MERWTKKQMDSMSDIDFAIAILNERKNALSNPYSPLSDKLGKAIKALSTINTANKSFDVDCLRAYPADDGVYKGITIDIVCGEGDLIPVASVERYPDGSLNVHAYADINDDVPTYSVQVASSKELESLL